MHKFLLYPKTSSFIDLKDKGFIESIKIYGPVRRFDPQVSVNKQDIGPQVEDVSIKKSYQKKTFPDPFYIIGKFVFGSGIIGNIL